jgi:hypothetical protein
MWSAVFQTAIKGSLNPRRGRDRSASYSLRTHLPSNGDTRAIPLNAVALAALKELRGEKTRTRAEPCPSVRNGDALQGATDGSTALEEAKSLECALALQPIYVCQ